MASANENRDNRLGDPLLRLARAWLTGRDETLRVAEELGPEAGHDAAFRLAHHRLLNDAPPDLGHADACVARGFAHRNSGDARAARDCFREAGAAVLPALWPLLHVGAGDLSAGRVDDAEDIFLLMVEHGGRRSVDLLHLGFCAEARGDDERALELFRRAVDADPASPDAHLRCGMRLHADRDLVGAQRAFAVAASLDRAAFLPKLFLAIVSREMSLLDRAIALFEELIEEHPERPEPLLHLAHAYAQVGRVDDAVRLAATGRDRFPSDSSLTATTGLMLAAAGRWSEVQTVLLPLVDDESAQPVPILTALARAALRSHGTLPASAARALAAGAERDVAGSELRLLAGAYAARAEILSTWAALFGSGEPRQAATPRNLDPEVVACLFRESAQPPVWPDRDVEIISAALGPAADHRGSWIELGFDLEERIEDDRDLQHRQGIADVVVERERIVSAVLPIQLAGAEHGDLTLPTPFGTRGMSRTAIVLDYDRRNGRRACGSCIAYLFDGEGPPCFALFCGEDSWPMAWYHPVADAIVVHRALRGFDLFLRDRVAELKTNLIVAASSFRLHRSDPAPRTPTVLVGSVDYISTHFFIDLSGLDVLASRSPAPETELLVTAQEVFGSVEDLFPDLCNDRQVLRPEPEDAVALNRWLWSTGRLAIRISGGFATESVARRVLDRAATMADPGFKRQLEELRGRRWPVLFVAPRFHNRRWRASPAEIADVLNDVARRYPGLALILDGHAATIEPVPPHVLDEENRFFDELRRHLDSGIEIVLSAGRPLADGLCAAVAAHTHLSAQGTTTTKPVLIANKPGVVTTSRSFWWDVRAYRTKVARCETPWTRAVDLRPGDIYTDYVLDPAHIRDLLLDVLADLDVERAVAANAASRAERGVPS